MYVYIYIYIVGGAEWRDPGTDAKEWRLRQAGPWRGVAKVCIYMVVYIYIYVCVCIHTNININK